MSPPASELRLTLLCRQAARSMSQATSPTAQSCMAMPKSTVAASFTASRSEPGATLTVDAGATADGVIIAGGLADFNDSASTGTAPIVFEGTGGTLEIDGHAAPANIISGFAIGDTIDFYGVNIGSNATVTLLPGNVLELAERDKTFDFQLDPNDNFAGQTNRFALVANMLTKDGGKEIVAGNERVLRARLSDAKFFWDEDRKKTLESRVEKAQRHRLSRQAGYPSRAGRAH